MWADPSLQSQPLSSITTCCTLLKNSRVQQEPNLDTMVNRKFFVWGTHETENPQQFALCRMGCRLQMCQFVLQVSSMEWASVQEAWIHLLRDIWSLAGPSMVQKCFNMRVGLKLRKRRKDSLKFLRIYSNTLLTVSGSRSVEREREMYWELLFLYLKFGATFSGAKCNRWQMKFRCHTCSYVSWFWLMKSVSPCYSLYNVFWLFDHLGAIPLVLGLCWVSTLKFIFL